MPFLAHIGEIAALGAAACWVFTSLSFAAAGRRVGATTVNVTRILLATVILGVISRARLGGWIPEMDGATFALLAVSGVLGLAVGDQLLFIALVDVGPRLSTLLMTLAPPVAALLAWPVLDETLTITAIAGMAVTVAGIAWVVMERAEGSGRHPPHARHRRGIVFASLAGICQAAGLVLAKLGLGHGRLAEELHLDPWTATLVRMAVASIGVVVLAGGLRAVAPRRAIDVSPESEHISDSLARAVRVDRRSNVSWATLFIVIGTIFGPVLGVWCSMVAIDHAEAGVAATLMATTPVLILPFAALIEKERITWRAGLGAVVAIAGVFILANGG